MQTTTNYGLKKPEATDLVDIGDLNYNADKIDDELAKRGNCRNELIAEMTLNTSFEIVEFDEDAFREWLNATTKDNIMLKVVVPNRATVITSLYNYTELSDIVAYGFCLTILDHVVRISITIGNDSIETSISSDEIEFTTEKDNKITTSNFFSPSKYPTMNATYEFVSALATVNNLTMPTLPTE